MFLLCLLLWILFNGRFTLEILLFGIVVSAAVYAVSCALLGFSLEKDRAFIRRIPGIFRLLVLLLKEVVKANLTVTGMIYSGKKPDPCFTSFRPPLRTTGARVALADCITLTPGTITGRLEDGQFTVHCLDKSMADGLDGSSFVSLLQDLEGEEAAGS